MSEPIVSLRNVVKHYTRGKQDVPVLDGLDLDIAAGEFVALMGPERLRKDHAPQLDRWAR